MRQYDTASLGLLVLLCSKSVRRHRIPRRFAHQNPDLKIGIESGIEIPHGALQGL